MSNTFPTSFGSQRPWLGSASMEKNCVYVAVIAALLLAVAPFTLGASNSQTVWCQSQQVACNDTCDGVPRTATVNFDCIDKGSGSASSPATRAVTCQCLDRQGNILSSSSAGAGAGSTTATTGSSSTSTASSSSTSRVGGRR